MIDLDERAVVAEADAQGIVGLADVGERRRDEPVAVRLIAEVEEEFDPVRPAAAAGDREKRHGLGCSITQGGRGVRHTLHDHQCCSYRLSLKRS